MATEKATSRSSSFFRTVLGGILSTLVVLGFTFGVDYAVDAAANPWAYGLLRPLIGGATPVGTWVGSGTLNDARTYRIRLVMAHLVDPTTDGFSGRDLTGESTACTPAFPLGKTNLAGDVGWTGKSIKLDAAFAANGVKPVTTCTLHGDALACTLFYENKRSEGIAKALKKVDVEVKPKTVEITFTRLGTGATAPELCDE